METNKAFKIEKKWKQADKSTDFLMNNSSQKGIGGGLGSVFSGGKEGNPMLFNNLQPPQN